MLGEARYVCIVAVKCNLQLLWVEVELACSDITLIVNVFKYVNWFRV